MLESRIFEATVSLYASYCCTRIALEPLREKGEAAQAAAEAAKPRKKLSARLSSFRL